MSLVAALSLSACPPIVAADAVIEDHQWNTYHSMGCMMLRECKDGTRSIRGWRDLGPEYKRWSSELNKIFRSMKKAGIDAYIAEDKYFVDRTRGLYNVNGNNFFLNAKYLDDPGTVVSVIRHEGWHAVQDCMAGTLDNTLTAVVWHDDKVPDWVKRGASITYETSPIAIPYEAEAMYAAHSDFETADGLEVCANPDKVMWEYYPPTPLTYKWLLKNGYYDK